MSRANYESYKKAYMKQQAKLTAKGLTMYDSMYTKSQFEAVYDATRNDLKHLVKSGKRRVVGNVTQTLVSEQTYEYSKKQGKALQAYAKATGQDLTQQQIRAGQLDWSMLEDKQLELKRLGLSKSEIRDTIGNLYFGSE